MISVKKIGCILHILLNNTMNKLSYEFALCLSRHLLEADDNPECSVIIVSSANPKTFCVGAAVDELIELSPDELDQWLDPWKSVASLSKPIIMALDGYVLGGGLEIAMMGDILIATKRTLIGQPEIKLALLPGCGGTLHLTQLIGYHRAFEMCVTGDTVHAQKAYEWGLFNALVEPEELLQKALDTAQKIASLSSPAVKATKGLLKKLYDSDYTHQKYLDAERKTFKDLLLRDAPEGLQAFMEKRAPSFKS